MNAQVLFSSLESAENWTGLHLNENKTECMPINIQGDVQIRNNSNNVLKRVDDYKYLGSHIPNSEKEFNVRNRMAWSVCNKMEKSGYQISNVILKSGTFEQQSNMFYYTVLKHGLSPQNNNAGLMDAILVSCNVSKIYPVRTTKPLKPSMGLFQEFHPYWWIEESSLRDIVPEPQMNHHLSFSGGFHHHINGLGNSPFQIPFAGKPLLLKNIFLWLCLIERTGKVWWIQSRPRPQDDYDDCIGFWLAALSDALINFLKERPDKLPYWVFLLTEL